MRCLDLVQSQQRIEQAKTKDQRQQSNAEMSQRVLTLGPSILRSTHSHKYQPGFQRLNILLWSPSNSMLVLLKMVTRTHYHRNSSPLRNNTTKQ